MLLDEGGRLETSHSNPRERNDCRYSLQKLKPKGGDAMLPPQLILLENYNLDGVRKSSYTMSNLFILCLAYIYIDIYVQSNVMQPE